MCKLFPDNSPSGNAGSTSGAAKVKNEKEKERHQADGIPVSAKENATTETPPPVKDGAKKKKIRCRDYDGKRRVATRSRGSWRCKWGQGENWSATLQRNFLNEKG